MAAEEQRTSRYTTSLGEHPLTEEGIASLAITPSGDEVPIIVTLGNLFYIDTSDPDNDERHITIRGGYHSTLAQALRICLGHRKNAHYTISDGTNLVGEGCTISQFLQLHPDGTPPHFIIKRTLQELMQISFDRHNDFIVFTVPPTYPDEVIYYDPVDQVEVTCQLIKHTSFDWNPFDGLHDLGDTRADQTSFMQVNMNLLG
jgi:hypothetical protein